MSMTKAEQSAYMENQLRPLITRFGHAVQGVFDPDTGDAWAYTVGLNPELVVTGMSPDQAVTVINGAVDVLAGSNRDAAPGVYDDLVGGEYHATLRAVRVDDANHPLTFATFWRADSGFYYQAMQLVWPDDKDRFPWDPDYNATLCPQPLLPEA